MFLLVFLKKWMLMSYLISLKEEERAWMMDLRMLVLKRALESRVLWVLVRVSRIVTMV